MGLFTKKKTLPKPTGPYAVSCADLMTGFSQEGIFVRLFYPAACTKSTEQTDQWFPWLPHDKYVQGLASVVGLWEFIIRIAMWWYGGFMHVPAMWEANLLPKSQRENKKLPVVIFSHGFGATRFLCSTILVELASQGYVVASLEHRDTSACATYFYESPEHRDRDERTWIPHTRLQIGAKHYALRNRQLKHRRDECVKALDLLQEMNEGKTSSNILNLSLNLQDFKDQLDLDKVTAMGHSFGGATALLTLSSDSRFKQGVILDGWMFPLKDDKFEVPQPLLLVNTPTFHISSNLTVMNQFIQNPQGATRQLFIIKTSTHETQSDTPMVLGYWLDSFKDRIDPALGSTINSYLILRFLQTYTGVPDTLENIQQVLNKHQEKLIEGSTPSPVPPRRAFSLSIFT